MFGNIQSQCLAETLFLKERLLIAVLIEIVLPPNTRAAETTLTWGTTGALLAPNVAAPAPGGRLLERLPASSLHTAEVAAYFADREAEAQRWSKPLAKDPGRDPGRDLSSYLSNSEACSPTEPPVLGTRLISTPSSLLLRFLKIQYP